MEKKIIYSDKLNNSKKILKNYINKCDKYTENIKKYKNIKEDMEYLCSLMLEENGLYMKNYNLEGNLDKRIYLIIKKYKNKIENNLLINNCKDNIDNKRQIFTKYININQKLRNIRRETINIEKKRKVYEREYINNLANEYKNNNLTEEHDKILNDYKKFNEKCNKRHIIPKEIKNGRSSNEIIGDKIIKQIYNENNKLIFYNSEHRIDVKRINNLVIDYYLLILNKDNKIIELYIELDGQQHNKYSKYFDTLSIIQSDMIKEDYAFENGISFLRVGEVDISQLYNIINKFINDVYTKELLYKNTMIDNKSILKKRIKLLKLI